MKLLVSFLFILVFILSSCDRIDFDDEINARNFNASLDENPVSNYHIGEIAASSSYGRMKFAIDSQAPEGAFKVHETKGEIRVSDPTLFDYESDSVIIGTVKVSNSDNFKIVHVEISVLDIDE